MDTRSLYDQAVMAHRSGNLAEAERGYQQILALDSANMQVRYPLGILRAQQGRLQEALELIAAALRESPDAPEMLLNYGNMLMSVGRFSEALASLDHASDLQPHNAGLQASRAMVLMQLQRFEEALGAFDSALRLAPTDANLLAGKGRVLMDMHRDSEALAVFDKVVTTRPQDAEAHNSRGNLLLKLGHQHEALAAFDKAVALQPEYFIAHNNRGNALKRLGRYDEAATAFDHTLRLQPDFAPALYNRGKAMCEANRIAEGFADFLKSAQMSSGVPTWSSDRPAQPHKARHDAEQQAYLRDIGSIAKPQTLHIEGGGRLVGPAINPAHAAYASEQWRTSRPQLVVIDDLLTNEALAALRHFCWGSTVWRSDYEGGYLGAFPEHGFATPLLAQIADEFRIAYAGICGSHALNYIWAFKYDSRLDGIAIHADKAAVNVNFWITPDEANLDPAHGGLVVWDKAAPPDWDFDTYNGDIAATRDFLKRSGAQFVTVPYRANRAVIFNSDLFHETDAIRFQEGYLNRRINVTLLYGERNPG